MKVSTHFKQAIVSYLWQRAGQDKLFAPNLAKANKNIDDCILWKGMHNIQSSRFFNGLRNDTAKSSSYSARCSKYDWITLLKWSVAFIAVCFMLRY